MFPDTVAMAMDNTNKRVRPLYMYMCVHAYNIMCTSLLSPPTSSSYMYMYIYPQLSVVYSDHSLYVWDVRNLRQIRKLHSFLHHNACIWDLCVSLTRHSALLSACVIIVYYTCIYM